MIREELNTQLTFLFKQDYMNETLHAEILFLHDINYEDGMVRPKLTYEYRMKLIFILGLIFFMAT